MDAYAQEGGLTAYERAERTKRERKWMVTWPEAKLLLIASTGFFIDAYDLFVINLVVPMLNYEFNGGLEATVNGRVTNGSLSSTINGIVLKGGVLKAAANLGCIVGQIGFGLAGDIFGRKAVYGKELMITILGTIMIISVPTYLSAKAIFTWITCFRVLMGIGIGGDYPMSAAVVSDRANQNRRGLMLTFIFAMQGWGAFLGGIVTMILLAIYKTTLRDNQNYGHIDSLWRLVIGVILVPCFGTLIQRLVLPESTKYKDVQRMREDPSYMDKVHYGEAYVGHDAEKTIATGSDSDSADLKSGKESLTPPVTAAGAAEAEAKAKAEEEAKGLKNVAAEKSQLFREFKDYFSEWRHLKTLIGTAGTWFLVDITFYGISLNQSIVISAIGLNKSREPWQYLFDNTKANLIITAAGFLPGYYLTLFTIEYIGRRPIQIGGFLANALFLGILAGDFAGLRSKPAAFIVVFAFLQLSFNFGANATTFVVPAEVFPTRVRGFAHGFSAACGKVGAVISSLAFAELATDIGTDNVLYIFMAVSILGAILSLLLPETKGRDADDIDLQERREARRTVA